MEDKEYSRYGVGMDCPLLIMSEQADTECRVYNCAWWTGEECAITKIAWNLEYLESAQ